MVASDSGGEGIRFIWFNLMLCPDLPDDRRPERLSSISLLKPEALQRALGPFAVRIP